MLKRYIALGGAFLLLLTVGTTNIGSSSVGLGIANASTAHETVQHEPADTHNAVATHGDEGHGAVAEHGAPAAHGEADAHGGGHAAAGGHEVVAKSLTPDISWQGWLPIISIFFPLFMAFLIPLFNKNQRIRDFISVFTAIASFGLIIVMFGPVVKGVTIGGQLYRGLSLSLPFYLGFDATFNVDPMSLLIAGVTIFLWILSTINNVDYGTHEEKRTRYEFFVLASLAANLGVLMAGDFLTLFVFFEGMVIFPYPLIAHKEDEGAMSGSGMYLRLGITTGLCLFFGMLLMYHYTGTLAIAPLGKARMAMLPGNMKYIIATLMIVGFGGKAGLFFEHIWLPNAHPVAPTPASCLLSGAMIKAGAYGIIRVASMLFIPAHWSLSMEWVTVSQMGYVIIWVGIFTMFYGVLNALISANSKRMLAYHSVSQMGYIVMGIGVGAYLGADGAMGLSGAMYHMVNHAIFKASLFLTVGTVYFRTHELDMYKMGGLWKRMPLTCVAMFIAVCGIAGIPGFNGFASKTLLHHSIFEAYEHSMHFAANGLPDVKLKIAEVIFMITAGGTFASNFKLWALDFFGKCPDKYKDIKPAPFFMKVSLIIVSVAILFIGLNPNWMLEHLIGPALAYFNMNPASHPYHIIYNTHAAAGAVKSTIPLLYNPVNMKFFDPLVIHNILGGGDAVILGGTTFVLGMRFGWFHSEVPEWLTVKYYIAGAYHLFRKACFKVFGVFDTIYGGAIDDVIFSGAVCRLAQISGLSPSVWDSVGNRANGYDGAVDSAIFSRDACRISGISRAGDEGIWDKITKQAEGYDGAVDSVIFSRSACRISEISGVGTGGVWDKISASEARLDHAADEAIREVGGDSPVWGAISKQEARLDHAADEAIREVGGDSPVWGAISAQEDRFDHAADEAMREVGGGGPVWGAISSQEAKLDHAADEAMREAGGGGPVWGAISSQEAKLDHGADAAMYGVSDRHRVGGIWGIFDRLDTRYDEMSDGFFLGDWLLSSRKENWFDKLCTKMSSIHSGDVSRYLGWVVLMLAVILGVLIGTLTFGSFMGMFLIVSMIIVVVGIVIIIT